MRIKIYVYETWCLILRNDFLLIISANVVHIYIFGSVREEITGDQRKLCIEVCYDLYSSPDVIQVIISRMMKRMRCGMHGMEGACLRVVGCKSIEQGDHLIFLGMDGRIILIWIVRK